jgi:hypothetical protein
MKSEFICGETERSCWQYLNRCALSLLIDGRAASENNIVSATPPPTRPSPIRCLNNPHFRAPIAKSIRA